MNLISEADFRKLAREGALSGGYLFFGDEDFLKAHALRTAKEALCPEPAFEAFNEITIDLLDFTPQRLLDALMPMPMMADFKLITLAGFNFGNLKPRDIDDLCDVLALLPEYDYNILIIYVPLGGIDAGSLPKRPSALLKRLGDLLTLVNFEKSTPAKLCTWIERHFADEKISVDRKTSAFLLDYCGKSMYVLRNEITKLCAYLHAHGKNTVTEDDIKLVSIPSLELDAFGFANAIMAGRHSDALDALATMKFRQEEPIAILGEVINVYTNLSLVKNLQREGRSPAEIARMLKMHEYAAGLYCKCASSMPPERLDAALALCSEADTALKLSSKTYAPLEKLICSL